MLFRSAGLVRVIGAHRGSNSGGVFHHHHGVRAGGQGSARHDLDRLTRADGAVKDGSGANFADHFEFSGQIGGADGEPVASRACEGRIVAVGRDVLGQNAAGGLQGRDGFGSREGPPLPGLLQHQGAGLFKGTGH